MSAGTGLEGISTSLSRPSGEDRQQHPHKRSLAAAGSGLGVHSPHLSHPSLLPSPLEHEGMALLCAQRCGAAALGRGSTNTADGKPRGVSPAHHRANKPHNLATNPHSCSREPKTSSVLNSYIKPARSEPPVALQHQGSTAQAANTNTGHRAPADFIHLVPGLLQDAGGLGKHQRLQDPPTAQPQGMRRQS